MSTGTDIGTGRNSAPLQSYTSVREALRALAAAVTAAQQAGPLSPVTVIAPSHASAMDLLHFLGRELNGGRGSASIRALTLHDLAQELSSTSVDLAGRTPLAPAVREGAVAAVLHHDPGAFAEVANQPATARAIASTSESLDGACPQDLQGFSQLVCEVIRVHRAATDRLSSRWYTSHESFRAAGAVLGSAMVRKRLGAVFGFMLTAEQDPSAAAFRSAVEEHLSPTLISARQDTATGAPVFSASDADDETRAVVRLVVDRLHSGIPGHRIGVFYPAADPYRSLFAQRLNEAGVTFVGPAAHGLCDTSLARGLKGLLSLDPAAPDVRIILDVMSQGALNWQEGSLPSSAACERLHAHPPETLEEPENDEAPEPSARDEKRQHDYARFTEFVAVLGKRLEEVFDAGSWTGASAALTDFVAEFLGPRSKQERPEPAKARELIQDIVRELEHLEGVAPAPTAAAVRAAVEHGISAPQFREGTSGTGVSLGTYADGVGRDLDVVLIAGAADGLAPARIRENPLLPDSARELLTVALPTVHERSSAKRDGFRMLLATGTETIILYPRGNLRGGGDYEPSRWLNQAKPTCLSSFAYGLMNGSPTDTAVAPTGQEWRVRRLLSAGSKALVDDTVLSSAHEVRLDRRAGRFTRFNGNLSGVPGLIIDPDKPISPTHLEDWVISPLAYFLRRVLRAELFEDVTLEVQISNMQRGNLMHKVLEDYVRGITDGSHPISSARLLEIAEGAFETEANAAWLRHAWDRDKSRIRTDLQKVHDADHQARETGWDYLRVEAEFGSDTGDEPVVLDLDDGTRVSFRGKVDRVDRHTSGQVRVIDYKTGKSDKYKTLTAEDPTAGGTRFQLPIYGLFARRLQPDPTADVRAEYRFITATGKYETVGYTVGSDVVTKLRDDAGLIMTALRSGLFPPRPESDRYANHTTLMGAPGVRHTWERLKDDAALSDYARFFQEDK